MNVVSFSNIESAIRRAPEPLKQKGRELKILQELVTQGTLDPGVLRKALATSEYSVFGHPLIETYWSVFEGCIESLEKQIQALKVKRDVEMGVHNVGKTFN